MTDWIAANGVDGKLLHYDAVSGELLELTHPSVHAGIVRKGVFFVITPGPLPWRLKSQLGFVCFGGSPVHAVDSSLEAARRAEQVQHQRLQFLLRSIKRVWG
jgi:hypothetical protein